MRFLWSSARKDLGRRLTDPLALVVWLGIPLFLGGIMVLAFGGRSGPRPRGQLLVADEDHSFLSRAVVSAFGQGRLAEMVEVQPVDRESGERRMGAGEASALLVIPEGFGEKTLREEPVRLLLVTNPSERILPGIVQESLELMTEAAFYLQRLAGEPLRRFRELRPEGGGFPSDEAFLGLVRQMRLRADRLKGTLFPPVIDLETRVEGKAKAKEPPFGLLFLPGMLFMALMFVAQGITEDIWEERRQGTLRRVLTTPGGIAAFLAGKLLAGVLVVSGVSLLAVALGGWVYGLALPTLALAWLWASLSGLLFLAAFQLLHLLATSQAVSSVLSNVVLFPLLMLGGSFFPFEAMPRWMQAVGALTPNGWALIRFKQIVAGTASPAGLAGTALALVALAAALYLVCLGRLRGRFGTA